MLVKELLVQQGVPVAYMQLDDWWYQGPFYFGNVSIDDLPALEACTLTLELPLTRHPLLPNHPPYLLTSYPVLPRTTPSAGQGRAELDGQQCAASLPRRASCIQ